MESVCLQVIDHLLRIRETLGIEFIVTFPVSGEPSGIEVDHIRRDLMLSEIGGNVICLSLREITDAAHPGTEAPERWHLRLADHISIFVENILRLAEEDEEVHCLIFHKEFHRLSMRLSEITGDRCRGVHEDTISPVAHKERHRLVHIRSFRTLRICHEKVQLLTDFVQRCR